MRDPQRIHKFLKKLEYAMKEDPSLTIGKIINLVGGDPVVYYLEEDDFIVHLQAKSGIEISEAMNIKIDLEDKNLEKIESTWSKFPDMRFGQLICNLTGDPDVLNKVTDDILAKAVEDYYGGF